MTSIQLVPDTPETSKAFNTLARHEFIQKLYEEILFDLQVCEIEGWDKMEFINMLYEVLNHFKSIAEKRSADTSDKEELNDLQ